MPAPASKPVAGRVSTCPMRTTFATGPAAPWALSSWQQQMPKATITAAAQWRNTLVLVIVINLNSKFGFPGSPHELLDVQKGVACDRRAAHGGSNRDFRGARLCAAEFQAVRVG